MSARAVPSPRILALDFDGVLCDGLQEYFQTSWRAYGKLWPEAVAKSPDLERRFARLRPVIETGWEMPVLIRAIVAGATDAAILADWPVIRDKTLAGRDRRELAECLDGVRDARIAADLEGWLGLHRFYPGTLARLQSLLAAGEPAVYIVTTKEGRFVRQLLAREGLALPDDRVIGKEIRQPKPQTLLQLLAAAGAESWDLWFVEDRLQTLQAAAQTPELAGMGLFLAEWGYNTERDLAAARAPLQKLSLATFASELSNWRPQ